jgi:hypothetical protein
MTLGRLCSPTLGVALFVTVVAGCVPMQRDVPDSSRAAPPVDSQPAAVPAASPVAAAQPESHIGKMSLLELAGSGGVCSVEPRSDPRITMVTPFPLRNIVVDVGDSNRAFRPTMLDISMSRSMGTGEEKETFYATFDPTGRVKVGMRQYRTSGSAPGIDEQQRLFAEDSAAARQLALQVVQLCQVEVQKLRSEGAKP